MPGGVNSPVRAFKSVGGQPIIIDSVKGSRMWDIDGNEYIDYVGSWGPAIIGHADDQVSFSLLLLCLCRCIYYPNPNFCLYLKLYILPFFIILNFVYRCLQLCLKQ